MRFLLSLWIALAVALVVGAACHETGPPAEPPSDQVALGCRGNGGRPGLLHRLFHRHRDRGGAAGCGC